MFIVYTQRQLKDGSLKKGMRKFRTEKERVRYIISAPLNVAITGWN